MKKYVWLVTVTVLSIGLILWANERTQPHPVSVETLVLQPQTVRDTVECTGRVELAESQSVFFELPCVAGEVFVQPGQTVSAGDPLFTVDVAATQTVLAQMGSTAVGQLDDLSHTVTAPTSGTVVTVNVQEGQLTDTSTPCAVIAPGSTVRVAAVVREKYLQRVAVGQPVEITGVGFEKPLYKGRLTALSDTARQQYVGTVSETVVDATISLDNGEGDESLRVGLGATARIVVETVEQGLLVPYDCILQEGETEYVYVCDADGTARRQPLAGTKEYADGVLVVSGLAAGDRLVRNPEILSEETVAVTWES